MFILVLYLLENKGILMNTILAMLMSRVRVRVYAEHVCLVIRGSVFSEFIQHCDCHNQATVVVFFFLLPQTESGSSVVKTLEY